MNYEDCNDLDELLAALEHDIAVLDEIILSYEVEAQAISEIDGAVRAHNLLKLDE